MGYTAHPRDGTEDVVFARRELDRVLAGAVDAGEVAGVVAMAADDQGVIYEVAFGSRELGQEPPMTLDSVFWIASMTKPVTAVAAMQLVEQGRIALDEPVAIHLPELAATQVLEGFAADGAPVLRPTRRPITLRHLLTHTAGFAYPFWDADLYRYLRCPGVSNDWFQTPLLFDPGERWRYGTNIDWVGRLVERVSKLSLEAYFREYVLDPLGMSDTSFVLRSDLRARLAGRHQRQPDGSLRALRVEISEYPSNYNGGGGLCSTGPDYLRFLRMLLNGGQLANARVLQAETVAEMATNQIGDLSVEVLRTAMPESSNDVEFFPGQVKKWGLGGMINVGDLPTGRSAGSWAWAGLCNTYFWIDPASQITGLLLTQIFPFADPAVLARFDRFERLIYKSRA